MSETEVPQGTLDLLILRILESGSKHGYAIARDIERLSDRVFSVEQGSLYPALHRMERAGWIRARWGRSDTGRRVRSYTLTASGRRQLGTELSRWQSIVGAIGRVIEGAGG